MDKRNSSENSSANCPPLFGVLPRPKHSTRSVLRAVDQLSKWEICMVDDLAALVGGIDALEHLDTVPLPDEPFDWSVVADTDCSFVENLLGLIDEHVERLFGVEYRTVAHRLVERIASRDPATLRSGSEVRTAAAITWLALRGNGVINGGRWPTANGIWAMFRVSSCAARGRGLFKSAGLAPRHVAPNSMFGKMSDVWLSDPCLLHSESRDLILRYRDAAVRVIETEAAKRQEVHPIKRLADGNLSITARPITPRWAIRTHNAAGRAVVLTTYGESDDDPEVFALSIPDARHLVSLLERALDSTTPALVS